MSHFARALAATACSVLAVSALAPPATAAQRTFQDRSGDVRHGVDLESVTVVNEKNVRVVVQHRNLSASSNGAGMTVYLDTDRAEKGPEFALSAGLSDGTDYYLVRTDGWKVLDPGTQPDRCSYRLRLDYVNDVSRVRIGRGCLERPDEVRVAVRAGGTRENGKQATDWLGGRRDLTPWVAHG